PRSPSSSLAQSPTPTSSALTSALPPISLSIALIFTPSSQLSLSLFWPLFLSSSSSPNPPKTPSRAQQSSSPPSPPPSFISPSTLANPPASNYSGLSPLAASPWTGFPLSTSGSSQFSSPESFSHFSPVSSPKKSAPAAKAPAGVPAPFLPSSPLPSISARALPS